MSSTTKCTLLIGLIVIVLSTTANADEPLRLEQIVVTGSRMAEPLVEVPANVTVITREDIAETGARSVPELLNRQPGVFTSNILDNPKQARVDIRGYGEASAQNVLVLVDGRRINNIDLSGADFTQIPMDMIERVEVYRGPGTVLYGDNANAGVINIILRKGEGTPKVTVGATTGSYNLFNPQAYASGKQGAFSFFVLGSSYDSTGYRHNNTLRMKDASGNFSLDPTERVSLFLKTGYHQDTFGMPGALSAADLNSGRFGRKDSKTPDDSGWTEETYVDGGMDLKLAPGVSLTLAGSYRNRLNSFFFVSSSFESRRSLQTYGFTPKLTIDREIFGMKNVLVTGLDYYHYPTTSNDFGSFSNSNTDIDKTSTGVYAHYELHPLKELIASAGYRFEKAVYDINYTDRTGFVSPIDDTARYRKDAYRFSLNYLIGKMGNVFATYAQGFRFPTTEEFFSVFSVPPVNPNLLPQVDRSFDLGVRLDPLTWLGGSITLFNVRTKDEIFFNPLTFANENYDKTQRKGVEAGLYLKPLKGLSADFLYSYIEATFDGGPFAGNDIPLVPRNKFSGKLTYGLDRFTFTLIGTYVGSRYLLSDQTNSFPQLGGYTTYDFSVRYVYKDLTALASVKNLTGKKFYESGVVSTFSGARNFYPAAEQMYSFRMEYTF